MDRIGKELGLCGLDSVMAGGMIECGNGWREDDLDWGNGTSW